MPDRSNWKERYVPAHGFKEHYRSMVRKAGCWTCVVCLLYLASEWEAESSGRSHRKVHSPVTHSLQLGPTSCRFLDVPKQYHHLGTKGQTVYFLHSVHNLVLVSL